MRSTRYAGFIFPVIGDTMLFAERGKNPHKGLFGPFGGKADPRSIDHAWSAPYRIGKLGGASEPSIADRVAEAEGREGPLANAIRETCEELFTSYRFPDDFPPGSITDIVRLGVVIDVNPLNPDIDFHNTLFIARFRGLVPNTKPDEVPSVLPIQYANHRCLFPMAQIGIAQLAFALETFPTVEPYASYADLYHHLPVMGRLPVMDTLMPGYLTHPGFDPAIHGR